MRVELRSVTRWFGRSKALDGLSLDLAPGARIALIGPNGSGKSTLSRILGGMLAYEGEVRIGGLSAWIDRGRLAPRTVYVAQSAPQLGASVGEIVEAIASVRGIESDRIRDTAERLELNIAEVASRPVRALSGGMKQKLLLSLAFASEVDLFLLDEPTASLDAQGRSAFYRLVEERLRGATLILCSHRLEEVRHLVDHVVALADGKLAWQGPLSAYLEHASHAVIEVRTRATEAAAWLRAQGFHEGGRGDWARVVDHAASLSLVRELSERLNGQAESLRVRDLDVLEAAPARPQGPSPAIGAGAK